MSAAAVSFADLSTSTRLPRLGVAAAAATNRLARMPVWAVGLGSRGPARFRWRPEGEPALLRSRARFRFRLGAQAGELVLGEAAQALLLDEACASALPYALRCVLVADAVERVVASLETASGERFEWLPLDAAPDGEIGAPHVDPSRALHFEFALEARAGRVERGCVLWDDEAALAAVVARLPERSVERAAPALRLPLAFALGDTTLGLAELRGIARGDIVALERWTADGDAIVASLMLGRGGRTSLVARIEGRRATLSPWKEFEMTPLATDDAADAVPVPLDRLDALDVTLRFEVGHLSLSLRELRGLAPGHVFDLGQPLERSTVRIHAQGNLLGQGHLVAVGERLGVRVTEFAHDAN